MTHANHQGEPGDTGTGGSGRVTLLPSALWQALDAEAEIWARETDLASWLAQLSSDPRSREKLGAVTRLCFEKGFYRGAMAAIEKRSLADSINEAASAPTPPGRVGPTGLDGLCVRDPAPDAAPSGYAASTPITVRSGTFAPSPDPAGAGGDLGELEELSAKATPGPWRHIAGDDYFIESDSYPPKATHNPCVVDSGWWLAVGNRPDDFGEANSKFIVALVNAYRSGKLVASTGSEDETKGACWHSIETAPKDGTPILVFRDNGCGYDYYVVWWTQSDSEYPWQEESGNSYPDGRFDGWREIIPPATALYTLQAGEEVRDA